MAKPKLVMPLEKVEQLPAFEGLPVVAVGVEAPGISGGLNEALTVEPRVFASGDDIAVVIIGKVKRIVHEPVDKKELDGDQKRIHVMTVDEAALVEVSLVDALLVDQRAAIEAAVIESERKEGIHRLPMSGEGDEDDEATVMARMHNQGSHKDGLRDECQLCRLEAEYAAEENGTTVEEEFDKRRAE